MKSSSFYMKPLYCVDRLIIAEKNVFLLVFNKYLPASENINESDLVIVLY